MLKVLKFSKKYWYIILAIFFMLVIQVYGELTLPSLTSDIVDVGIQNKGIEYPIPEQISKDTYDNLMLFMTEDDKQIIEQRYTFDKDRYIIQFTKLEKEQYDELKEILLPAQMLFTLFSSDSEEAITLREQMLGGTNRNTDVFDMIKNMPEEQLSQMMKPVSEKLDSYPEYMIEAMGVSFVESEYEKLGMNMDTYQMEYLKRMGIKMLSYAIMIMLVSILIGLFSSRLAASVGRDVRSLVFNKVMSFSNAEMNQFSTSSLITRCTNDVQQIQMLLTMFFRIVLFAPLMGIGSIFKVMETTTKMVWVIALAVILIMMLIMVLMLVAMPKFKIMQKLVDGLNLVSREILTGLSVIRAFGRENHEKERFDEASTRLMKTQLFTTRTMALMMPTMTFIMNGVSILIIWSGAHHIDTGTIQVGDMIAFITYAMHIVISFLMISMVSIMMPRAAVAADRIDEVIRSKTLILDKADAKEFDRDGKGEIEFSHVSFAYPNAKEHALNDINFVAEAGKTTAIIGSTGCGKSTLVHLIPRLFDVTEGSITIDGVDIRDIKMKELRKNIGFVPQKGVLFSGTIASNIKFGNIEADKEQMEMAAGIAQATEFIEAKEDGYDSAIAQGGNNVSGGQKQRLAIARAIAKNPKIYVFDDSFSALDYKTDAALRKALNEKVSGATVLIVAQRISTILHADKILVLEDGEIVGQGTHEELLRSNEVYQQIAQSQLSQKDLEGMGC